MAMKAGCANINIAICSDSQVSIYAIVARWRLGWEWQVLMGRVNLVLIHVHFGMTGIEIADEFAKKGEQKRYQWVRLF